MGFILTILIAIPFSVYVAQKRQQTTTKAAPSTTLSLEPSLKTMTTEDTLVLSIMMDPGSNQVSFVKLSVVFDPKKFTIVNGLTPNTVGNTLTNIIDEAQSDNTTGKASISLSIGSDPTRAVITKTKIATFEIKPLAATAPTGPNITFDSANTQVLSIASSDQTSENVLSTTAPAKIAVTSTVTTPTITPIPISTAPISRLTIVPSLPPSSAVCSGLEINGPTTGTAPYSVTFTAAGNNSSGTISKISFNFGDSIEDLTTGGGIGTSSVSGQLLHTYKTPGIYTAYAILTDNNSSLSVQQPNCTQTITINSADLSGSPQPTQEPLPPTGDGKAIFGLGTLGIIITIIGGALLLL